MRRRLPVPFVAVLLLLMAAAAPVSAQEGGTILQDPVITSSTLARTGEVTVTGTVECEEAGEAFLDIFLRQDVGRFNTIRGFGGTLIECTEAGEVVPFTATVNSEEGRFASGRARAFMSGFGECDEFSCNFEDLGVQNIRLTRR